MAQRQACDTQQTALDLRQQLESRDSDHQIVNSHLKALLDGDGATDPSGTSYNSFNTFGSFASFSRGAGRGC
jgi:hypothetical protein